MLVAKEELWFREPTAPGVLCGPDTGSGPGLLHLDSVHSACCRKKNRVRPHTCLWPESGLLPDSGHTGPPLASPVTPRPSAEGQPRAGRQRTPLFLLCLPSWQVFPLRGVSFPTGQGSELKGRGKQCRDSCGLKANPLSQRPLQQPRPSPSPSPGHPGQKAQRFFFTYLPSPTPLPPPQHPTSTSSASSHIPPHPLPLWSLAPVSGSLRLC